MVDNKLDDKLNKIIKSREIKRIYRESSGPVAYENLKRIVNKHVEDWYERWVITRRIFLDYVKNSNAFNNKKNSYENALMVMMTYLDDDTLIYLLSQNINYNFSCSSESGVLLDELALNIQLPNVMKLVIEKINDERLYFANEKRNQFNDLCSMNVFVGDLDKALEVFNREDFSLSSNYYIEEKDCLIRIVDNLIALKVDNSDKISFLDNIFYSKKINVLNTEVLDKIKSICSLDKLKEYYSYFSDKKGIVLYGDVPLLVEKNKVKIK